MTETEVDWWEHIGQMRWQHIVLTVAAIAGFVALCFAPSLSCSAKFDNTSTTTTTVAR